MANKKAKWARDAHARAWPYRTEAVFFVHTTFFGGRESTLARKAARQIKPDRNCQHRRSGANVGCPVGVARAGRSVWRVC